jgi:hypothetical protein
MKVYMGAERTSKDGRRTWVWSPVAYYGSTIMPWNPVYKKKAEALLAAAEWLIAHGQNPETALPHVTTKPPRKYY